MWSSLLIISFALCIQVYGLPFHNQVCDMQVLTEDPRGRNPLFPLFLTCSLCVPDGKYIEPSNEQIKLKALENVFLI